MKQTYSNGDIVVYKNFIGVVEKEIKPAQDGNPPLCLLKFGVHYFGTRYFYPHRGVRYMPPIRKANASEIEAFVKEMAITDYALDTEHNLIRIH